MSEWNRPITVPFWRAFLALNLAGWAVAWSSFSVLVAVPLLVLAVFTAGLFQSGAGRTSGTEGP